MERHICGQLSFTDFCGISCRIVEAKKNTKIFSAVIETAIRIIPCSFEAGDEELMALVGKAVPRLFEFYEFYYYNTTWEIRGAVLIAFEMYDMDLDWDQHSFFAIFGTCRAFKRLKNCEKYLTEVFQQHDTHPMGKFFCRILKQTAEIGEKFERNLI